MNRVMLKNVIGNETEVNRHVTVNVIIICTWACKKLGMESCSSRNLLCGVSAFH